MVLVQSVQLTNFRGFREHTVALDPLSVLVGHNNAGKSTFIDALRLLAVALRRLPTANFQPIPDWLTAVTSGFGYTCSFDTIDFDFRNIHFNYDNQSPAKLQIVFSNRVRLTLWFGSNGSESFAQISNPIIGNATSRADARTLATCPIVVMPPVGPLIAKELAITKGRIREFMFGRLASRHFRNQLYEMTPEYRKWKSLIEQTWPKLVVDSLISNSGESGRELSLIIREGPFASEAAWVGSGLQAWMQILWFLCRADTNSFVVLDEPDIYLHADMQRKIAKLVINAGYRQAAIATHSAEIIGDVDPSAITVIRKRERSSWKPSRKRELQQVIDELGSRHNLQLSKLSLARKITLYEGEDQKYLSEMALKIDSDSYQRFQALPSFDINGVDNWKQAVGAGRALHTATDGSIPVYLVIDRDYKTEIEIQSLREKCIDGHLVLYCWSKKEIESFFVDEQTIFEIVAAKANAVTLDDIRTELQLSIESLTEYTVGVIADQWHLQNKKESVSAAMMYGKAQFASLCSTRRAQDVVSGKRLISELSSRTKKRWNVSFGPMTLCRSTPIDRFDSELTDFLKLMLS